ncbi:hypothetical protein [Mycoplasma suis]|uniref:Uncharacterized protein n=2 Tax=Mycoplasma suis TaxID=57372 RepID=F0QQN8_MYCSL|nr:hypothetical protein [Mycoplasma suis]ADX97808.1 hypothetical protein MSU_0264 [Mycoplasma suis str. Illinois]CBZ40307.1 hypothetical protein MSUIS_02140 [Mycoplasma suis KI3806]
MIGSKLLPLLFGGAITVGGVGAGINWFLGENVSKLTQKPKQVDYRNRPKSIQEITNLVGENSSKQEPINTVNESDLDWEYILFYGNEQKKCEFGGKDKERWAPKLGTECTTDWLRTKKSQGKKNDNPNSKTDLTIRRKNDFVYGDITNLEGEVPLNWINYFLDDFKNKEKIELDFVAADCTEVKEQIESSQWKEWKCFVRLPDSKLNN